MNSIDFLIGVESNDLLPKHALVHSVKEWKGTIDTTNRRFGVGEKQRLINPSRSLEDYPFNLFGIKRHD